MTNNTSVTSFNQLASETILDIFEYLSCNDIINVFFDFNERFKSIILEYQHLFKNFETPITNFYFWENILLIFGSHIQYLTITTIDFDFSLKLFPNLKSLIIDSPFPIDNNRLYSILEREQFNKLTSFKIKSEIYYNVHSDTKPKKLLFENILHRGNSLETFEYLSNSFSSDFRYIHRLTISENIYSLSLKLPTSMKDVFSLLRYTPNLKDLKMIGQPWCFAHLFYTQRSSSDIKLEKFYFIAARDGSDTLLNEDFIYLFGNAIEQFSSSLIYLSINFSQKWIMEDDDNEFDGITLEQRLLKSMIKLKTFHLYVRLKRELNSMKYLLPTFENQFWFDHNWSFGIHENYLYTLPFHFDKFYDFIHFDLIKRNYSEILNSPFTWYHVKSIDLSESYRLNSNLIKQIKIKMPNLKLINLNSEYMSDLYTDEYETTLDSITTVHCEGEFIENIKQWLIYVFPNVKHLVLSYSPQNTRYSSNRTRFLEKLYEYFHHNRRTTADVYFSMIQDVEVTILLRDIDDLNNYVLRLFKQLLKIIKNSKSFIFMFYRIHHYSGHNESFTDLEQMITLLNRNKISTDYQINHIYNKLQFIKKEK